jgi:7,8-dihydropterin-6-yl-methyl-4-(beta-D-ribofuranosyl)aminobenzene 5'-phosphate synthase
MPSASSAALKQSARVHRSSCPGLLGDSIGVTGFVPRETSFENTGGAFFLDPEATWADPISDDQSMWIQTEKGLVIVAGCCHAGIVNTIDFIQQVVSDKNVFALIGGLHLHNASQDRIHQTCDLFSSVGIQAIMPCHCTGEEAVSAIRAIQAVSFLPGYSGSRFETV